MRHLPLIYVSTEQRERDDGWLAGMHRQVRVCVVGLKGNRKELPGTNFHAAPKKTGDKLFVQPSISRKVHRQKDFFFLIHLVLVSWLLSADLSPSEFGCRVILQCIIFPV